MTTKLVYVLTCAPEANYIEQALMSVWSARHWNPDAHIVLITDNLTDQLFVGKRAEILDYISEKIVVPFEDDSLSMMYRSRWLKTSVRQLIKGDFLFLDTDTIICASLSIFDKQDKRIMAVNDSLLPLNKYCKSIYDFVYNRCLLLSIDIKQENNYFCSGVLFVKDCKEAYLLYGLWHQYWIESTHLGLYADQPALCKANIEIGHIINLMDDTYNLVTYTQDRRYRNAKILHISFFQNSSYLQSRKVLSFVRKNGLKNPWLMDSILHPASTFFPFDNLVYSSSLKEKLIWTKDLASYAEGYGVFIDSKFTNLVIPLRSDKLILFLFRRHYYRLSLFLWMCLLDMHLHIKKAKIKENIFLADSEY